MSDGALHPVREKANARGTAYRTTFISCSMVIWRINTGEEVTRVEHPESEIFNRTHPEPEHAWTRNPRNLPGASSAVCDRRDGQPRRLNVPRRKPTKSSSSIHRTLSLCAQRSAGGRRRQQRCRGGLVLSEEGARTTMAIWREDWENRDPKAGR